MINLFNSKIVNLFSKSLDTSAFRSQLLAQNLANVNTPNYKRMDLDFEAIMSETAQKNNLEMNKTHPLHMGSSESFVVPPSIIRETETSLRSDGNNVDIENEMAQVTENSLYFQAVSQKLKSKFDSLHNVIKGS